MAQEESVEQQGAEAGQGEGAGERAPEAPAGGALTAEQLERLRQTLVEANPEKYSEQGRFTPPNAPAPANQMEKSWTYPVVAEGCLYVRDKESLWCYDIKDRAGAKKGMKDGG